MWNKTEPLERLEVTVDTAKTLSIFIDKVFSEKTAAIRELIQNAVGSGCSKLNIFLEGPKEQPNLTFLDDGCGMSREDIKAYLLRLGQGINSIGQFGVGFFSSLALSDELIVVTRKKGTPPQRLSITKRRASPDAFGCDCGASPLPDEEAGQLGITRTGTRITLIKPLNSGRVMTENDVKTAIARWCRFLDVGIYFQGQRTNVSRELANPIRVTVNEQVSFMPENGLEERTAHFEGVLALSTGYSNGIALLKHWFVVNNDSFNISNLEGLLNCNEFNVPVERDKVLDDAVKKACVSVIKSKIPLLLEKLLEAGHIGLEQLKFVQQYTTTVLAESGALALDERLAKVPLFRTCWTDRLVSVADLRAACAAKALVYHSSEINQVCEDLTEEGYLILSNNDVNDTLRKVVAEFNGQMISVDSLRQNCTAVKLTPSELDEDERLLLALCRKLDPGIEFARLKDQAQNDIRIIRGLYRQGLIYLNLANKHVSQCLASAKDDRPLLLGLLPLIVHERAHERYQNHSVEFYRAVESLTEERLSYWLMNRRNLESA